MVYTKLAVKWSEEESCTYLVNFTNCGWEKDKLRYWLKSYSGTYYFYPTTGRVILDTGTEIREKLKATFRVID